jgi:hypothetical protein
MRIPILARDLLYGPMVQWLARQTLTLEIWVRSPMGPVFFWFL